MTLNYHKEIMTSHPWTFFKLLLNWRASVWKHVIVELICWLIVYGIISVIYRCALAEWQMEIFERVVRYCSKRLGYIPLDLLLGFYVSMTVDRWVYRYRRIGFIDNPCLMTAEYVRGHSDVGRMFRRTIIRYAVLGQIMVFRDISMRTKRRFPTLDSIVKAGFMTEIEKKEFESYNIKYKQWICFNWAYSLVYEARKKGLIKSDLYVHQVIDDLRTFRTDLETCNNYDWTPIPLLYNHVVCLAVHFYFLVCLIARQFIIHEGAVKPTPIDIYFPFMPMLQFFFYMSWLKIAEVMMNPYGEDDDDWETNALIDRNIHMGMAIVDAGFDRPPELRKDVFWDDEVVDPMYAENTQHDNGDGEKGMRGSASQANMDSHSSLRGLMHLRHRKNSKMNIVIPPPERSKIPDRPIVPNRASILSLEGLKNIKKKVQKTTHYEFYPNGEGVAGLKAEKGKVIKKQKSCDARNEVDMRTSAIRSESPEFTVIDLGIDDHTLDYRIPSAPVEVIIKKTNNTTCSENFRDNALCLCTDRNVTISYPHHRHTLKKIPMETFANDFIEHFYK